MRAISFSFSVLFLMLAMGAGSQAQTRTMDFTLVDVGDDLYSVKATGRIADDTPSRFATFLRENSVAAKNIVNVSLNSDGGSLGAGMELGRMIRRLGVATVVDVDARCYSACAYAFLGGKYRVFATAKFPDDGSVYEGQRRLGFHSFTYDIGQMSRLTPGEKALAVEEVTQTVQRVTSILSDYVSEMGVNTEVVSRSSAIPAGQFLTFNRSELIALNIITWREEIDTGTFVLVPDGAGLLAVFQHEDHQFILACTAWRGGPARPVMVFSQSVAATRDQLPATLEEPVKLSRILRLPRLPWTMRDREHKHFHAHDWIKLEQYNPVFSGFTLFDADEYNEDGAGEQIALDEMNVEFRSEPTFFHGMVLLTPSMARKAITSEDISAYFLQGSAENWGHFFRNKEIEREVIAFALRPCT